MDNSLFTNAYMLELDVELLYGIASSNTREELIAHTTTFCHRYDLERWIYGLTGPDLVLANYSVPWLEYYARHQCHRGRDPFVNGIHAKRRAVAWNIDSNPPWDEPLDRVQKMLVDAKWEAGIRSGVTAPLFCRPTNTFDFGVISFSRTTPLTPIEQEHLEPWVQVVGAYFQSAATSIFLSEANKCMLDIQLSSRERDCLCWASAGESNQQIADRLGLSAVTVKLHLSTAAAKLGTRGRTYSIAKAIRLGLIDGG